MEQLQSHIRLTAFSYMEKYLRISSYVRKPFLKYDFAIAPLRISLYMRKIWFSFLSVRSLISFFLSVLSFTYHVKHYWSFYSALIHTIDHVWCRQEIHTWPIFNHVPILLVHCPCTVRALFMRCPCTVRALSMHFPCTVRALSVHCPIPSKSLHANRIHSVQQSMHGRSTPHQGRHHTQSVLPISPISGRTFRPPADKYTGISLVLTLFKRAHLFVYHRVLQNERG